MTPARISTPADRGEREVRDRDRPATRSRCPGCGCGSSWGRPGPASPYATGGGRNVPPTAQSTRIRPGSSPLPNGSNQAPWAQVSRPHSRGVGSCSRDATNARAYSRALIPISSDSRQVQREPEVGHRGCPPSIHRWTSGGGGTSPSRHGDRRQHAACGLAPRHPPSERAPRRSALPPPTRSPILARTRSRRRGRSDRPCGSDPHRGRRSPLRSPPRPRPRAYRPGRRRSGGSTGAAGSTASGSSTTWGSPPCASIMRRNRSSASPSSIARSARDTASSWPTCPRSASSALAANATARSRSRPRNVPRSRSHRLHDVERVADRVARAAATCR